MKKLTIAAALMMAFCSAQAAEVNVGTAPGFAPFEFVDAQTNKLSGFDIDIIKAIVAANGDTAKMQSMGFDALIPALKTKSVDVIIAGMTITDARKKNVTFSEPYYQSGLVILVPKKNLSKIKGLESLENKKICTQIGTTGSSLARSIKGAKVSDFNVVGDAILDMKNGGCEAVISDKPVVEYYLNTTKDKTLAVFSKVFDSEYYGIAVDKKNKKMAKKISDGLKKIKANGTYDKIYAKWFK